MSKEDITLEIEELEKELAIKKAELTKLTAFDGKVASLMLDKKELEDAIEPDLKQIQGLQVSIAEIEQKIKPQIEALERIDEQLKEIQGSV